MINPIGTNPNTTSSTAKIKMLLAPQDEKNLREQKYSSVPMLSQEIHRSILFQKDTSEFSKGSEL